MSFLLSLIFSLQQNQRRRGWNRFCLEVRQVREIGGTGERGGPNNVYTYE
jgi:hypothetical protein